ncbi:MAG: DUF5320 domain-containing protein [Desulfatibacillaceae bacterium]|nr:DUF5320 domain-containing protein [Desulfatibacillaceae bacterium]
MPGFDGTGPRGMGPQTGGGFGRCNPANRQGAGFAGRGFGPNFGRGFGRGLGRGRGFGGGYIFADFPKNEALWGEQTSQDLLLARLQQLENELAAVRRSLGKVKSAGEDVA